MSDAQSIVIAIVASAAVIVTSLVVFSDLIAAASILLGIAMILITVSDARSYIIPDALSLPMIPLGLCATYLVSGSTEAILLNFSIAILAAGALYLLNRGFRFARGRDGLGLGDVKLAAAAGAWTGPGVATALLAAALAAIITMLLLRVLTKIETTSSTLIPFGMFFAPTIWAVWCLERLLQAT